MTDTRARQERPAPTLTPAVLSMYCLYVVYYMLSVCCLYAVYVLLKCCTCDVDARYNRHAVLCCQCAVYHALSIICCLLYAVYYVQSLCCLCAVYMLFLCCLYGAILYSTKIYMLFTCGLCAVYVQSIARTCPIKPFY